MWSRGGYTDLAWSSLNVVRQYARKHKKRKRKHKEKRLDRDKGERKSKRKDEDEIFHTNKKFRRRWTG